MNLSAVAVVLGAVQGLTEFLPISSSGHLILTRWLFGWDQSGPLNDPKLELALDSTLHLGTAIAVVWYFRADLARVFGSLLSSDRAGAADKRLAVGILVGSIPAAIVGKLWEHPIEEIFRERIWLIAAFLAGFGVLLWAVDRYCRKTRAVESVTIGDAVAIGVAQAMALAPGVSRSGITMTAGMALGLTREASARFSFLLMSPIVLAAALVKLNDLRHLPSATLHPLMLPLTLGVATSAIVGMLTIAVLLRFLRANSMAGFAVYRVVAAALVAAMLLARE